MESPFERSTRELAGVSDLRPEILAAIRVYFEKFDVGDIESNVIICCETTSVPKKKHGRPGKVKESDVQHTGVILTPELLVWGVSRKGNVTVAWADLKEIEVGDYARSNEYALIPDVGIDIFGFIKHGRERGSAFLGLGEEEAATRLRVSLGEAVEKAGGTWKR